MKQEQAKATAPSEEKLNARRSAVKKILGAGGVAGGALASGKWTKPVVESVVLPAHAQTTGEGPASETQPDPSLSPTDPCGIIITCGDTDDTINITINGFIVPALPNVTVGLLIQMGLNGTADDDQQIPPVDTPQNLIEVVTDPSGDYTHTESNVALDPNSVDFVTVTASLPDFPDGGTTTCTMEVGGEGDQTGEASGEYFCNFVEDP